MKPKQAKPITFKGVTYATRRKLAAHLGLSESALSVAANKVGEENLEAYYAHGRKRKGLITWTMEGKDGSQTTKPLVFWTDYFRCHCSKLHRLHTHYVNQGSTRPAHDTLMHCARDARDRALKSA